MTINRDAATILEQFPAVTAFERLRESYRVERVQFFSETVDLLSSSPSVTKATLFPEATAYAEHKTSDSKADLIDSVAAARWEKTPLATAYEAQKQAARAELEPFVNAARSLSSLSDAVRRALVEIRNSVEQALSNLNGGGLAGHRSVLNANSVFDVERYNALLVSAVQDFFAAGGTNDQAERILAGDKDWSGYGVSNTIHEAVRDALEAAEVAAALQEADEEPAHDRTTQNLRKGVQARLAGSKDAYREVARVTVPDSGVWAVEFTTGEVVSVERYTSWDVREVATV
jgi:hypothetical protein